MRRDQHNGLPPLSPEMLRAAVTSPGPKRANIQFLPLDVTDSNCVVLNMNDGIGIKVIGGTSHLVAMATAIAPSMNEKTPNEIAERAASILLACEAVQVDLDFQRREQAEADAAEAEAAAESQNNETRPAIVAG